MVDFPLIRNMRLRDFEYRTDCASHVATFDAKLSPDIGARDVKLMKGMDQYYTILAYGVGTRGIPRLTLRDGSLKEILTERAAAAYEAQIGGAH